MKHLVVFLSIVCLFLSGCKPKVPSQYIQEGKMRRILYDYIIASEMARQHSSDSLLMLSYKEAIMKKHGVTVAEFDSSMVYYTRHTRLLYGIYEKIAKQLEEDAIAQGASLSDINKYGHIDSASDTASVWPAERAFVLSPYLTMNTRNFSWRTDTSYHKGDKLVFDFDASYISPEGMHNAMAVVVVKYAGDSTVTFNRSIASSGHYSITVMDSKRKGIEQLRCMFFLSRPDNLNRVQLLAIKNLKAVKLHTKEPTSMPTFANNPIDSVANTVHNEGAPTPKPVPRVPMPQPNANIKTAPPSAGGAQPRPTPSAITTRKVDETPHSRVVLKK